MGLPSSIISALLAADAAGPHPQPGPAWISLIVWLPLLACALCGLCAAFRVKSKLPAWITVASLGLAFILTVAMYLRLDGQTLTVSLWRWFEVSWPDGPRPRTFAADFGFYIDGLTTLWMLFVTGLGTLIALYASEYMEHDLPENGGQGYARFFAAFCLFVFSMACLVMGKNLLMLYLGWEGVGLCSYLLIGYFYKKPAAVAAAKKAFIVNRIGDLGLALGVFLTFVHFGSIEYAELFAAGNAAGDRLAQYVALAADGRWGEIPLQAQFIAFLLAIGAFGKSAQFPLYVWLPDAMEGPTPVSALIHAATMVTAGVYLIARTYPIFLSSEHVLTLVAWIGTITALLAATIGMAQFDIKRIMAYSTVSQLGYMFAGLGLLTPTGAGFHVLTHAFFKALLFLSCGAVMHGFAGQLDLRKLSGLSKVKGWLVVSICMLVGCLNLAGFPLITSGFFSKDMILAEAFVTPWSRIWGAPLIGWILLITAGLTAYYTFRVFFRVFMGPVHFEPGDEHHARHDDHAHAHADHGHPAHVQAEAAHKAEQHHAFHPHAPKWAINAVLAVLALLSTAAIGLYFIPSTPGAHGGWVGNMLETSTARYHSPYASHAPTGTEDHEHGEHGPVLVIPTSYQPDPEHPAPEAPTIQHAPEEAQQGVMADDHQSQPHAESAHAPSFYGLGDPHTVMYFVSAIFGILGIAAAAWFHLIGRTTAAHCRMDAIAAKFGPIPKWAENKWYVDELYDFLFRTPLFVAAHIFHLIDRLLVDGLVNLVGYLPRALGNAVRPSQSGQLNAYAVGMAGGLALILVIVMLITIGGAP